ncbi:MAG TPA: hypothetical protein VHG09_05605 [Longimicrobiales bacterium]|nr:hypothetical protein [Longimicrobiales bacterium]
MSTQITRLKGQLTDAATGTRVNLRTGRGPRAIVVVHSADCAECRAYLERLAGASDSFREWDGRVNVVVNEDAVSASALRSGALAFLQVLADPDAALGAEPAAVLLADEWGEVHFAVQAVMDHSLPGAQEIGEWMKFISIQCPECEQPEGEWRDLS